MRRLIFVFVLTLTTLQGAPALRAQAMAELDTLADSVAPETPLDVGIGVMVTQLTSVDQKAENFGVVARIRMVWNDPALAFDAEATGRKYRTLDSAGFLRMAREQGLNVPAMTIENQQARSFDKSARVTWFADGTATYAGEVIVTLQAPDFDFRAFPFDSQKFYVRILANAPSDFIDFTALPEASGMGTKLGEEEWVVRRVWTETDEVPGLTGLASARYSMGFEASRHMLYYWARIFTPLILLMGVAWANLFIQDYRRRIDVASGNLLAFIAFNFTIAGELPRLGYLTFIDVLMLATFLISAGAVAYNVALHRAATSGREARAKAVDWHVTYWGFPLMLLGAVAIAYGYAH
ncbi:hypothetical protein [Tropicimonas sp. IMCC34043]|uniref:hypothetical protein n=1 Tax=Tropicimonas sp. IMCC34043 TaxID=2248760 RepID=UPI000E2371B4|nr:hypothetical protein [Tropicimonas sp. IMCC34043]